jgi:Flp pilus assembly protein TadD
MNVGRGIRFATAAAVLALVLGGCMGRGGAGDVTGSIGQPQQPMTEAQWRAEVEAWRPRFDANPSDRAAALRYARALRGLGQHAQGVAVLQQAILRNPQDREMLGAYGRLLMDNGQLKQAQDVLARAHTPERPDWRILSAQGAVADQLGDHSGAQGYYEAALRIAPGEPTVMSNLGLSYALSKRLPEAERMLTEANAHPRADARVRQNLVLVLGLQGRFTEAEALARKDLPPAEADKALAQLRQMVSQPNSWDMLRQGERRARPTAAPAAARQAPTNVRPAG